MKHLSFFLLLLFSILFCSFSFNKNFSIEDFENPPGTIKITKNTYIDRTEIRTLDYCEFLHWTNRIFGNNSNEYISILPDTVSWNTLGKYYEKFSKCYLRDPEFRNYPVVGISYEQAQKFAKWRSDRVMEFILIRNGVFKYNPTPTKDSFFTTEKYFTGEYGKISKEERLQYYPVYSLPDSITYRSALLFADSLNNYELLHSKKKEKISQMIEPLYNENILNKNDTMQYSEIPIRPIPHDFYSIRLFKSHDNYDLILNLKGNVAEITSVKETLFGGSYMSGAKKELFEKNTHPNCSTGFRNICFYKKWIKAD